MFSAFLAAISFDRPVVRWSLAALAALVFASFVAAFLALVFHTSFVGGWGMLVLCVTVGLTLAIGLGAETMFVSAGREPPSFLPKTNRILIGVALAMAVSFVAFQLWMIWGASIHFPYPILWVLIGDVLIPLVIVGCGFAAMALGTKMGKEFLPAVIVFLTAGSLAMGAAALGESLVDPAIDGDLYYYFETPSGGPEAGRETPELTTSWFLKLKHRHLLVPNEYVSRHGKPAKLVDYDNPAHAMWVEAAELEKEANAGSVVWQAVKWVGFGLVGAFGLAVLGVVAYNTLKGLAAGTITGGTVLWRIFACVVILAILMCTGLSAMRLFGLTPEVEARSLRHSLVGGPNPFYRTVTVGPQAKVEMGVPDQTEIGYLCQCGVGEKDIKVYGQWTAWAKYSAELYSMRPQGCGRQMTFEGDQMYYIWNATRLTTPSMQFLRNGESFTCPDMTVVTAPN